MGEKLQKLEVPILGGPDIENHSTELCSGSEVGSYLRITDSCTTQLKAQEPSRTCNESKEESRRVPLDLIITTRVQAVMMKLQKLEVFLLGCLRIPLDRIGRVGVGVGVG